MKKLLIILTCLLLMNCATTGKYKAVLNTWMGHDVNNLITKWGPPANVFEMPNGNKMYTWIYNGGSSDMAIYNPTLKMTFTDSTPNWCKTTFTTDNKGTIIHWRYEGNSCRSN